MIAFRWGTIIFATVVVGLLGYGLGEMVPQGGIGWKTAACIAFFVALIKTHRSDWLGNG